MLKYGLSNVVELQMPMFREFDDQWTSSKVFMIFPCLLDHRYGGAEYPGLYSDWCNFADGTSTELNLEIKEHWRHKGEDAIVIPGI